MKNKIRFTDRSVFGSLPPKPDHLSILSVTEDRTARLTERIRRDYTLRAETGEKSVTFPATLFFPEGGNCPTLIFPFDRRIGTPETLLPPLEATPHVAFLFFDAGEFLSEEAGFRSDLARFLCPSRRSASAPGLIALWAWVILRMAELTAGIPECDTSRLAVLGHGKYGHAALLAGKTSDALSAVFLSSTDLSSDALTRVGFSGIGATLPEAFPDRFCPAASELAERFYREDATDTSLLSSAFHPFLAVSDAEFDRSVSPAGNLSALRRLSPSAAPALFDPETLPPFTERCGAYAYSYREGDGDLWKRDLVFFLSEWEKREDPPSF